MEEHFYALYVFTVQSNGGVATPPPPLVDFELEDLPYPREGPIHPVFASKWPRRMPRQLLKIISCKNRA